MTHTIKLTLCLVLIALFTLQINTQTVNNPREVLVDHYDDGSEMVDRIISEFLGQECSNGCSGMGRKQLLNAFEGFRSAWVDKMINLVIAELGVDAESARHVRQNPASYMISYETFKLLTFN